MRKTAGNHRHTPPFLSTWDLVVPRTLPLTLTRIREAQFLAIYILCICVYQKNRISANRFKSSCA